MKFKLQVPFFLYVFCSFLVIIIIFSVFILNVFRLSSESLNYEIIRHNSVELRNIATRFGDTISSASNEIIGTYLGAQRLGLRLDTILSAHDKLVASQFLSEVVFMNDNFIMDIFLYSANSDIVVTSNGSFVKQQLFLYSYYNTFYSIEFWDDLAMSEAFFDMLPAKDFVRNNFPLTEVLHLLPIVFKARAVDEYMIVAFVDIKQLLSALDVDESLIIFLYDGYTVLYKNTEYYLPSNVIFPNNMHYVQVGDEFYFKAFVDARNFSQNQFPNLHFVIQTTYSEIAANLTRQRSIYWILMLAAIVVSLTISYLLASTISYPIKKTVFSLIQNIAPKHRNIVKEFDMIGRLTEQMIADTQNYSVLLSKKNSLLRNYFYQMRLKNLHISDESDVDIMDLFPNQVSFRLAHFVLYYTPKFYQTMNMNEGHATFIFSEYYRLLFHERYPGTVVFPVEDTSIVSIVIIEDEDDVLEYMNELLKKLENELDYVHTTVVLGSNFGNIGQLNAAYNDLYELVKYEEADKEIQLVTDVGTAGFHFPPEQRQVLNNYLSKGDGKNAVDVTTQVFMQNAKKNVTLYYYRKLAEQICDDCHRLLMDKNLCFSNSIDLVKLSKQVKKLNKLDDLIKTTAQYVEITSEIIGNSLDEADEIITFVCDYIEKHIGEDIYLDKMSELLGITSNYLSHYFKEKTGVTFTDYLTGIRIKKAKELLAVTNKRIDEIALAVCYQHTNSFIRMFKKMTGQTPGEFRRSVRKN